MGLMDPFRMKASADEKFGTPEPKPANALRPLTASGQRINLKTAADVLALNNRRSIEWQNDAWAYYDAIGEIKYAFTMAANVISRIRLYTALNFEQDAVPTAVDSYRDKIMRKSAEEQISDAKMHQALPQNITPEMLDYAEDLVRELLTSGHGGQSGFMRNFALNMLVAGECFLVQYKGRWLIRSSSEIIFSQSGKVIMRTQRAGPSMTGANGVQGDIPLPPRTFLSRIWREHPRHSEECDSSMMSVREHCEEAVGLMRYIRTIARARINAGILFLPDGLSAAGSSIADDLATDEEELDVIAAQLFDAITAPVADETNAASVVPTFLTGPEELGEKIRYITFERTVDQYLVQELEAVMGRILGGLDVPKDMVQGMTGMRYSNASAMNEHMYQAQIEPMVLMLCDSLSSVYLRPMMKKKFPSLRPRDLDFFTLWYDPSEVVTKSDPSASADKGLDAMLISEDAWRKAHGFSDSDAPSREELMRRYFITKAPAQPTQIDMMFPQIWPEAVENARAAYLEKAPVPMPVSAQQILYGGIVADPADAVVNGNKPRTAEEIFNQRSPQAQLAVESSSTTVPGFEGVEAGSVPVEGTATDIDFSDEDGGDGGAPKKTTRKKKKDDVDVDFSDEDGGN